MKIRNKIQVIRLLVPVLAIFAIGTYYMYNPTQALAYSADQFVTTWKTDNTGSSNSTSIAIPTTGSGYNFQVDWTCDGTYDNTYTGTAPTVTHDYGTAGTYQVCIGGTFPQIYFSNTGDRQKILSVDNWGTGTWRSMASAFYGASNLTINATDTPNLSSVTTVQYMFANATSLNSNINNWNVSTVTNFSSMFDGATIFNQPLSSWDMRSATLLTGMFHNASAFNGDITTWEIPNVQSLLNTFYGASSFNRDISYKAGGGNFGGDAWNTSAVTTLSNTFNGASAFNQPIGNWNISNVTTLNSTFTAAISFNQPLAAWDTSKVTTLASTFYNARVFNQPIGNWNISNVTTLNSTFTYAGAFNQDITSWNTSNVTNMQYTFASASSFNRDISVWNTSKVTTLLSTFARANSFTYSLSAWDTSAVVNMFGTFANNPTYNGSLSGWDTSKVTTMNSMFLNATSFNQPINSWNTSVVTDMGQMFSGASVFNQNLATINISSLTSADQMLSNSDLSISNYDATLTGWLNQDPNTNVSLGSAGLVYCSAYYDHLDLINTYSWTITGDSAGCSDPTITITQNTATSNSAITDTAISIYHAAGIAPSNVSLVGSNASNLSCTQTTAQQLNCTVSVDATGSLQLSVNGLTSSIVSSYSATQSGYVIDSVSPTTPIAPDLQSSSDTGPSDTDNITNITTPTFDLRCQEAGSTLTIYIDGVVNGTLNCTAAGTVSYTVLSPLNDGDHTIRYTETDSFNNASNMSSELTFTVDAATDPITISTPTNGAPVTGTAEPGSTVVITTPSGATCTTTTSASGNYSCTLSPTPISGEAITATSIDEYGNISTATVTDPSAVDITGPTGTINATAASTNKSPAITGTVDDPDATVTVTINGQTYTATNNGDGTWKLNAGVIATLSIGNHSFTATFTDELGNSSTVNGNLTVIANATSTTGTSSGSGSSGGGVGATDDSSETLSETGTSMITIIGISLAALVAAITLLLVRRRVAKSRL